MSKRSLALLMGVTGDRAFAAGCLLQALRRHSPGLNADVLLFHDGGLSAGDMALLRRLGADPVRFSPAEEGGLFAGMPGGKAALTRLLETEALRRFSLLSLARLEGFRLLDEYRAVLWLDADTALQDDIAPLTEYGPLGLALEDPHFAGTGGTSPASINVSSPVADLDGKALNFNSGVLVLRDDLPDPAGLLRQCLDWLARYGECLVYPDQAVLNMLAQLLRRRNPDLVAVIPHDRFNAHPRNPAAGRAAVVHAFGAYKIWDDGLTRCAFPEWERDYGRWLDMGGSPWRGPVDNAEYLDGGSFFMLRRLFDAVASAQKLLDGQRAELAREREARLRLERALQRLTKD